MRTFSINGRLYRAVPFTFNTLADLEDMGISVADMSKKPMATIRAYFALCAGGDAEFAGNELQAHMLNGGDLTSVSEAMAAEMSDSDFFRNLTTQSKEDGTEGEEIKPKSKKSK